MDLRLSEEQQLIRGLAREFLERESSMALVRALADDPRGYSPELWQKMADLGWMGLPFPEAYGGLGQSLADLALLIEEQGRCGLPAPFFAAVVLCGLPIAQFGSEAQKETYLGAIAAGECIMTYAQTEPGGAWDAAGTNLTATPAGAGTDAADWVLDGTKMLVPYAHVADHLLVAGRARGAGPRDLTLFLVDARSPGISHRRLQTIGTEPLCAVTFQGVRVPRDNVLGRLGAGWPIIQAIHDWGAALKCAEMVGGAEQVLAMTVDYAKERVQFGSPIGSFQAIQHHCANMASDVVSSRHITYEAVWRLSEGLAASEQVSMAKAWVSDAYQRVCALGHQVHGAIGFTHEHDLQFYFRHAKAAELAFGDAGYHRELLAQRLGL